MIGSHATNIIGNLQVSATLLEHVHQRLILQPTMGSSMTLRLGYR
jgi:hypothetical protein